MTRAEALAQAGLVDREEYDRLAKQRDLLREAFVEAYEAGKVALAVLRKLPCDDLDFPEDHPQAHLEAGLVRAHEAFEKAKAVR